MTDVGAHIKIGARLVGVIAKLMCATFASLEKEDVSLCNHFKTCGSTQSSRSGKYHKQLFSVVVKMVRGIVLPRIEPTQIEIQVLRFYAFLFARNVCEQSESVDFIGIRLEVALFFANDCCHILTYYSCTTHALNSDALFLLI